MDWNSAQIVFGSSTSTGKWSGTIFAVSFRFTTNSLLCPRNFIRLTGTSKFVIRFFSLLNIFETNLNCCNSFQDLVNQNDPKELLTPEEYEELKLEIFTERKISTEAVADIKLTEEEIQAIRKKTKERRQVFHSKTEKDITDRWAFEEGVSYTSSFLYFG